MSNLGEERAMMAQDFERTPYGAEHKFPTGPGQMPGVIHPQPAQMGTSELITEAHKQVSILEEALSNLRGRIHSCLNNQDSNRAMPHASVQLPAPTSELNQALTELCMRIEAQSFRIKGMEYEVTL